MTSSECADGCKCFDCTAGTFDLERMKQALAGPAYVAPEGLTRDELIAWFADVSSGKVVPQTAEDAGIDFDIKEMEQAFDCEFVEPQCQTPEEFRQYVMSEEFSQEETGPDDF